MTAVKVTRPPLRLQVQAGPLSFVFDGLAPGVPPPAARMRRARHAGTTEPVSGASAACVCVCFAVVCVCVLGSGSKCSQA